MYYIIIKNQIVRVLQCYLEVSQYQLGQNKKIVCLPKRDRPEKNPPTQILFLPFFGRIFFFGYFSCPLRHRMKLYVVIFAFESDSV